MKFINFANSVLPKAYMKILIFYLCLLWIKTGEEMPKIKVPLWGQPARHYCVPACIKMILEYLRIQYGDVIPYVNIPTIARVVKTRWDGTPPKNVEFMNQYFEARLNVRFKALAGRRFPDITAEVNEKQLPVIVWLDEAKKPVNHSKILTDTKQLEDKLWHAVVVTWFDPQTQFFTYNDPWNAKEKIEEAGKFLHKWGVEGKMVKLLISTNEQAYLGTWIRENPLRGESANEQSS